MDYLRIAILFYAYVYANGFGAYPTLTLPNPIYYVDQSIAVSCYADFTPEIISIGITIDNDGLKRDFKCELYGVVWNPSGQSTSEDCGNLPKSGRVNLTITTQLVEKMKFATVACSLGYFDEGPQRISDIIRDAFSDAYVAPRGLEFDLFEFDGGKLVLNNQMRSRCKSQGGFPSSNYTYEVRNKSDVIVYSTTELPDGVAEFVINDSLKNGFKVTCRDTLHTRGDISLTKQNCSGTGSEWCLPRSSSATSTAIGVGVGVGIAVTIIAVIVGIVLYKKKKDNSKRYQNTPSDPPSLTVDKHEKPAENSSTQANNGGYPAYSNSDDQIVHAQLDQHTLGNKKPHPAKPNTLCAEEDLCVQIYRVKNRQLANKLTHYCSIIFYPVLEFTLVIPYFNKKFTINFNLYLEC